MKKIISLVLAVVLISACKPSVEGESKAWSANLNKAEQLKLKYPAYVKLVDQKLEQAKKVWDEAQNIADEEAKAEKMQEANKYLSTGAVDILQNLSRKISSLDADRTSLLSKVSSSPNLELRATEAGKEAKLAIDAATELLTTQELSANAAEAKLLLVGTKIASAKRTIDSVLSAIQSKQNAENKKNNTNNNSNTSTNTTTNTNTNTNANTNTSTNTNTNTPVKEAPKMVTCPYCGVKNDASASKCKGCGATL